MREVQKAIGLLADSDATVLLLGETGTGKEVVARAIHRHGKRAKAPFVPVNCAAIPADLLESLLFGHVRGAFTGAVADRTGSFREAQGGTLFLDEIGDMELAMQAKLLRALQERVITPVGGRPVPIDVRVIAATHRDLVQAVRDGRFREDLYYRLGVVPLNLPPLRERLADIIPLAEHFLALRRADGGLKRLSADGAARLLAHTWPGNVRELLNAMKRVATLVRRPVIAAADLEFLAARPGAEAGTDWLAGTLPEAVERIEVALIRRALNACAGNRAQAAERLGIRRQLLYQKLARYGLDMSQNGTAGVPCTGLEGRGRASNSITTSITYPWHIVCCCSGGRFALRTEDSDEDTTCFAGRGADRERCHYNVIEAVLIGPNQNQLEQVAVPPPPPGPRAGLRPPPGPGLSAFPPPPLPPGRTPG